MLVNALNAIKPTPISALCYATALIAGRKFCMAGACKITGAALYLLNHQSAKKWNEAGDDYLTNAKKDAFQDLTAVACLLTMGAASQYAEKNVVKQKPPKKEPNELVFLLPIVGTISFYAYAIFSVINRPELSTGKDLFELTPRYSHFPQPPIPSLPLDPIIPTFDFFNKDL